LLTSALGGTAAKFTNDNDVNSYISYNKSAPITLNFVTIGTNTYVQNIMQAGKGSSEQDKFSRENILNNVRNAHNSRNRVRFVISNDKQKDIITRAIKNGYSGKDGIKYMDSVDFVDEQYLITLYENKNKVYKDSKPNMKNANNPSHLDIIKMLALYTSPKNQLATVVDIDKEYDIAKETHLKKVPIGTNFGTGDHVYAANFARNNKGAKKLIEEYVHSNFDPNDKPYTNERAYVKTIGGNKITLDILDKFVNERCPHFLINAHNSLNANNLRCSGDGNMPQPVRNTLINGFHMEQPALGPTEYVNGNRVTYNTGKPDKLEF
jgi:hypothetical protein